jgi:hypothetical protein
LSAWGAEKELQLADGRILRGELSGEQDGQVLLALKVGEVSAHVRIDKKDILAIKDGAALQAPAVVIAQTPQAAPAAESKDGSFEKVKQLLAAANREALAEDAVPAGYYGYPYPTWQHWPWTFTLGGNTYYNGGCHGYSGHGGGHGGHGGGKFK